MSYLILILQTVAVLAGVLAALASTLLFIRLRWPSPVSLMLKLYTIALSPWLFAVGLITTFVGWATESLILELIGIYDALIFFTYILRVTRPPDHAGSFERAFGNDWESRISADQKRQFLPRRNIVKLPVVLPESRWQKDVTFATIPGTSRNLLCDVWQPPDNVTPTGLAFIYLHGSAFYLLDKDFGTRTLFRYLAAQGHVVMDVAYRLWPETDVMGMVHDVKRAIAWMKNNASTYSVSTDRIVLGGGSAGGHLALLAAYTNNKPGFAPEELLGQDTSVCAVASFYGSNDMEAIYYHTNQHLTTRGVPGKLSKKVPTGIPHWITKRMGDDYHRLGFDKDFEKTGTLAPLLGGHPDERPETYRRFSAITHVETGCPPTYLIHGDHDIMAPVTSTRALFAKLVQQNVPAVLHILPQTEHGFDLVLPAISPPAHTEFYEIERFLALHASKSTVKPRETAREAASLDKE